MGNSNIAKAIRGNSSFKLISSINEILCYYVYNAKGNFVPVPYTLSYAECTLIGLSLLITVNTDRIKRN